MSALGAETTLNLPVCPEIGNRAVEAIHAAYDGYHRGFEEITPEQFDRALVLSKADPRVIVN